MRRFLAVLLIATALFAASTPSVAAYGEQFAGGDSPAVDRAW